jgi:hypothetical protein
MRKRLNRDGMVTQRRMFNSRSHSSRLITVSFFPAMVMAGWYGLPTHTASMMRTHAQMDDSITLRRKMMASVIQTPKTWQIRLAGAVLLLLALLTGLADYTPVYADDWDDDQDEEEIVTSGPNACTATANLPTYVNATCLMRTTERDDGGTETETTYLTQDAIDTVRRAYEAAFNQNGWTLVESEYDTTDQEWEYTATRGQQRIEVTIEARHPTAGTGTVIEIEE